MAGQAIATPFQDFAPLPQARMPAVLVVDDDQNCIDQCARMLDDLNYKHSCVSSARKALECIEQDPSIQIIMAGMQIPSVNGFVLIEEARTRVGEARALAPVLLTSRLTTDLAIRGLHIEAVDLLCKPLNFEAYSSALRRAMRYLSVRRAPSEGGNMALFNQQLGRLVSMLENKPDVAQDGEDLTDKEMNATLRAIISSRSLRSRYLPNELFADPAWEILLDLTRSKLENQQVSVSSVCIAASVPMSTALRWVRQMTDAGLLRRWTDPKDRRRDLIALTDAAANQMHDYLTAVCGMLRKL